MVGIYKITNKINNKVYIGQSVNIQERWKAHRYRPFNSKAPQYNSPLYKAIRKYGIKNFIFEVIDECRKELLDEKEQYYIQKYNSNNLNFGYNLTAGGQSATISSKLSQQEILEIYNLLSNTNLSEEEIGKKFNVSQRLISGLNLGQYQIQLGYQYPIRTHSIITKKKNFCKNCQKEISLQSTYCINCAHLLARVTERPSREQLKKEIKINSFLALGRKYSVSDTTIRKWCKAYNLPFKKTDIKKYSDAEWE